MTTSRPSVTPRDGVLIPFIILSDSDDKDDSPGDELTETAESLSTQTASTSIVHPPPSLLPSSSSPPPLLLPSSSSPPPSLLPISSRKRPISPSPPPQSVSPPPRPSVSPPPPSAILPPPPEVVVLEVTATATPVRLHRMV
ncbi:hypothetical protein Tco_0883579, partial [Tanacetum coccineum]